MTKEQPVGRKRDYCNAALPEVSVGTMRSIFPTMMISIEIFLRFKALNV
jgi:hypothetical protein